MFRSVCEVKGAPCSTDHFGTFHGAVDSKSSMVYRLVLPEIHLLSSKIQFPPWHTVLPDHQRMDNRSENPIRRSIIDLSPDSPFIYEPIEPCHPLIFWCSLLSALLSSRNKFILPGPPISRPPEPRKVHRKLHWREALRKESLKSTFLFSIWTFSSKEQSLRSDLAAWFGKDGPNYPKIQIES